MVKSLIPKGKMRAAISDVNYPDTSGSLATRPAVAIRHEHSAIECQRDYVAKLRRQLGPAGVLQVQTLDSLITLNALAQCEPVFALDESLAV